MNTTTVTPRIYVACLAAYNNGILHGVWIDLLGKSVDEVWEEINAMLKASPQPHAEEHAIHDFEGLGHISEYESIERVVALAECVEEHGDAFLAFLSLGTLDDSEKDPQALGEAFTEAYRGEFDSLRDYVEDYVNETGFAGVPAGPLSVDTHGMFPNVTINVWESLGSYIDWDHIANEFDIEGYSAVTENGQTFIFGP